MPERKTILVVEDEGVVARQLQLSLLDLGYQVPVTAASADEAYQLAERHHPDLVLMDIHLDGGTDGIEVASVLRARFDVPIIYLTAYADTATVERAKVTEPYAYLIKPIDASKLAAAVEVALYKHELDQKLRLSETKFSGIVSLSVDAIITIDEDQRVSLFNDGAETIFGYSKAEVIGQPLDMLIPERLRAIHREHVARFAAGPTTARQMGQRDLAISGRRKNGEEFPADASISKLVVGGRSLLAVVLHDISDRKRVEDEQRFLSQLGAVLAKTLDYNETLASLAHMVVGELADWCALDLVDADGQVRRINVASSDPAKAPIAERLERTMLDRTKPHLTWEVLETKQSVLMPAVTAETVASLAQGTEHLAALRAANLRSAMAVPLIARGKLVGALVLASSRRYGANDLRLAEEVAYRAALAIENAVLYRAALAAVRARDAVMGVVSHDLRNPLSAIQMCTELFATDDPQLIKPVSMIKRSVDMMARLISDLRDVGSIEAGHLSIETRSEDVRALVRDALDGVRDPAAKKPVHLVTRWPDRDLVLECDGTRVIQVLTNLLSNAIKFTPQGGLITIAVTEEPGRVCFLVEDTGCGIPVGELPRVFDRYWQAKATAHLGTGLGLAIAKGIVEAHSGTMSVKSAVGHGTTFSFTLPVARDPVIVDAIGLEQPVAAKTGARVLVVDDEPNALSALASLLDEEGFVVETAADGVRALPKVREFGPDILIVDVEMPGLKGPELVRKVREDLTEIPVILMTGYGDHVVATALVELRASYIGKPVEIDELVSAIHRELDNAREAPSLRPTGAQGSRR